MILVTWADQDLRSCYCQEAFQDMRTKALIYMNAMRRFANDRSVRGKQYIGAYEGFYAFKAFALAPYHLYYEDNATYELQMRSAIRRAWRASRALGISRGVFGALMLLRDCGAWWAALTVPVAPCNYG